MSYGRNFMSPNGDNCRIKTARPLAGAWPWRSPLRALLRRARRRVPERAAVRDAVLLARRGHDTLLVERRGAFRAVIIDKRADRADLRVLARVAGGASVLAHR